MKQIILKQADSSSTDFICLCHELDHFLNRAIGGECKREKYKKFNQLDTMDYVVIAYEETDAVGCAALREYSDTEIEVKRVFVRESYRNRKIGGMLLDHLISYAKSAGYSRMILETGAFLAASVRLYARYGFEQIPNYGAYQGMKESLCMARRIGAGDISYRFGGWLSPDDLRGLFESVGWISACYADRLAKAFQNAGTVLSAWDNEKLIGLAEVLDDGELTAYLHYLLVHPDYQKHGTGSAIVQRLKQKYRNYLYLIVICEKQETIPFYEHLGFSKAEGAVPLQIRTL